MTPEQKAAYVIGEAACLTAKVLGMQAENQSCLFHHRDVRYTLQDFDEVTSTSQCHHNAMMALFDRR